MCWHPYAHWPLRASHTALWLNPAATMIVGLAGYFTSAKDRHSDYTRKGSKFFEKPRDVPRPNNARSTESCEIRPTWVENGCGNWVFCCVSSCPTPYQVLKKWHSTPVPWALRTGSVRCSDPPTTRRLSVSLQSRRYSNGVHPCTRRSVGACSLGNLEGKWIDSSLGKDQPSCRR
jgi:hypothetical protein